MDSAGEGNISYLSKQTLAPQSLGQLPKWGSHSKLYNMVNMWINVSNLITPHKYIIKMSISPYKCKFYIVYFTTIKITRISGFLDPCDWLQVSESQLLSGIILLI